jgi:hypothetical protein
MSADLAAVTDLAHQGFLPNWEARCLSAHEHVAKQLRPEQYAAIIYRIQAPRLPTATTRATRTQHALQAIETTPRIRDARIGYPILKQFALAATVAVKCRERKAVWAFANWRNLTSDDVHPLFSFCLTCLTLGGARV